MFDFIANLFSPAASLVDNLHTSEEEKLQLRNELAKIKGDALNKLAEVEQSRMKAMSAVQVAEANSKHVITATWRPVASLMLILIIVLASLGLIDPPDQSFYDLSQILIGGYAGGRSLEKVAASIGGRK